MSRFGFLGTAILIAAFSAAALHAANNRVKNITTRQAKVTGGPQGPYPYLLKSISAQKLLATGADYHYSIGFPQAGTADSLNIIALRVEFNNGVKDTSPLKTGDGLFGIRGDGDPGEYAFYVTTDTVYKYDRLPHDSLYFANQLLAAAGYFAKVSRGKLLLRSTIYPAGSGEPGYAAPKPVLYYSPGGKLDKESWDSYYARKTMGLMYFVRDALLAAAQAPVSPFANLHYNAADGTIRDQNNYKTVFLIFHAGASYLTNGGKNGTEGRDTPGDMIDAFINQSWFSMYQDSLHLSGAGVRVKGAGSDSLTISELMMCSETSNQDGLNWGIQGILVNQVARQIGIPDLFSTSSGESGVGAFCIMDFAGYSAGNGFIPPYPSAWVRAFMGWDNVKVASLGDNSGNPIKALTSVLDRDSAQAAASSGRDTTILLVPLNDHEYYLIENRQQNLSGDGSLFLYDSASYGTITQQVIAAYPFNVNIDSNVLQNTGLNLSNVITKVKNNDISLPASGILVWHVDEQIIRNRLAQDLVNADSVYRGVSLVEASGVNDIGVAFVNTFYQAVFYDYGGAEDVFPHETKKSNDTIFTVNGFGPYTAPSTTSNDGGLTYLSIAIQGDTTRQEPSAVNSYVVNDYADSVFMVSPSWNYLVPGWPRLGAPDSFYEPVLAALDPEFPSRELFLLGKTGRFYAWSTDTTAVNIGLKYGGRPVLINRLDARGDTLRAEDTAICIDSLPGTVAMPSAIANRVYIPALDVGLRVLTALTPSSATWDTIGLGGTPSSYLCGYRPDTSWAIGCTNGRLVFGKGLDTVSSVRMPSDSPVCAIAAIRERHDTVAVIQNDGSLSLCTATSLLPSASVKLDSSAVGPFTLVTCDIDHDKSSEIIVCDSRHGLWVYKYNLTLAPGWGKGPTDWPSAYIDSATRALAQTNRSNLPLNLSSPSLVDLTRNGYPDIVVGGTNGLYAFNYKNVLVDQWPAYLDNRFWYQRGSITTTPIAVMGPGRQPLVLFSSPTGQRVTFTVEKIDSANPAKGMIWFRNAANAPDSMGNLTTGLVDTLLTIGDSLVTPFVTPGGCIDARQGNAKRPLLNASLMPSGANPPAFLSSWPITTGASPATAPLAGRITDNAGTPVDLFVPATNGWVYRWRLATQILPDSLFWPQTGYDNARSFAYGGDTLTISVTSNAPITFWSYPNPMKKSLGDQVVFKYQFSGPATNVRLDILTFTGFMVFTSSAMGDAPSHLTGSYPDWNEFQVPIDKLGPGLYRCRMEATIGGKKSEKYWKLAITR